MKREVVVVGGGAIGVCSALELARSGASVTLLERGAKLASGCSAGNAGLICPSHSAPISNPTSLRNGIRWMWKRDSPFYLRPRPAVLPWLVRFALAARHAEEGTRVIRALSNESLELHAQLGEELGTSFERTGDAERLLDRRSRSRRARRRRSGSGLRFDVLDAGETQEQEPSLTGRSSARSLPRRGAASTRSCSSRRRASRSRGRRGDPHRRRGALTRRSGGGRRRGRGRRVVEAARRPPARGRKGLPHRLRALAGRSAPADLAPGDVDDRDAAPAGQAAPVGDARARRPRPLDLAAEGRRDPPRRRPLVPRARRAHGDGDVGRASGRASRTGCRRSAGWTAARSSPAGTR